MKGCEQDYKGGIKNQWRCWAWNEISKRVDDKKTANILYLSGQQDLDRNVAVRKGFNQNNMISIDNNDKIVKSLRKNGNIAVNADFFSAVLSARAVLDVDIVYADLCCGLTEKVDTFLCDMATISNRKTILLINLQRGRDIYISKAREMLSLIHGDYIKNEKDRSYYSFLLFYWHYIRQQVGGNFLDNYLEFQDKIWKLLQPVSRSYKSHKVTMDTMILTIPKLNRKDMAKNNELLKKSIMASDKGKYIPVLRAAKAIQTMKKSNKLSGAPKYSPKASI